MTDKKTNVQPYSLSEVDVINVFLAKGALKHIAREYNVSITHVSNIKAGIVHRKITQYYEYNKVQLSQLILQHIEYSSIPHLQELIVACAKALDKKMKTIVERGEFSLEDETQFGIQKREKYKADKKRKKLKVKKNNEIQK